MSRRRKPELLAPAGSPEALEAAIAAGADAVYLGASAFSNRMRARNFSAEEMAEALQSARYAGVSTYVTINTRVRQNEMDEVLALAEQLLRCHCTGFILADMGIAAQIHSRFPEAVLHASTQMTLSDPTDGAALRDKGFTRMVVPREISLSEVRRLTRECPLEIEMFLHGAHCVSLSGQCLMSWAMGGRSGNRGECAQPCRLPYGVRRLGSCTAENRIQWKKSGSDRIGGDFPLSLKDMCLAEWIPAILDSGIASLKIEGRQKPAAYVYGVTKIYRTLLDEERAATREELAELDALFSRDGFTDGYFAAGDRPAPYRGMLGVRASLKALAEVPAPAAPVRYTLPTREISGTCTLTASAPAVLTLQDRTSGISVTVSGETPQAATGNPLTAETVLKNLLKYGGTPFHTTADGIKLHLDDGLWCPVSALNALRRAGVAALTEALFPDTPVAMGMPYAPDPVIPLRAADANCPSSAVCTFADQITPGALKAFTRLYLPLTEWRKWRQSYPDGDRVGVVLPPLSFGETGEQIAALADEGCPFLQFHTPGQLYCAVKAGIPAHGSFRLNLWNRDSALYWYEQGAASLTASPEATLAMLRQMPVGAIVYGHLPLMHTSRCFLAGKCGGTGGRISGKSCPAEGCIGVLTDRTHTRFPVLAKDGICEIHNGLPLWMGDQQNLLPPLTHREFLFTIETPDQIEEILRAYRTCQKREGRRLR